MLSLTGNAKVTEMASWRAITKGIATSPRFVTMSEWEQLLFIQMVVQADDFGRLAGDPLQVKLICCPATPRNVDEIAQALDTMRTKERRLIRLYSSDDGATIIQIEEWDTTQPKMLINKRTSSKYPEPNDNAEIPGSSTKFQEVPRNSRKHHPQTETEIKSQTETEIKTESWSPSEPLSVSVPESGRKRAAVPVSEIFDLYMEHAAPAGLVAHHGLNDSMRRGIKARWREKRKDGDLRSDTLEWWSSLMQYVAKLPHLCGDNDRGWRADLLWLTKPANLDKIVAQRYEAQGRNRRGIAMAAELTEEEKACLKF